MRLYTATITSSIAAGAEASAIITCEVVEAGKPIVALAVAARDVAGVEIARRLLHLKVKSGTRHWPRDGYANAELCTGTGLQASWQASLEIVAVDSTGRVTMTVKNKTASTIVETDVAIWVGDHV